MPIPSVASVASLDPPSAQQTEAASPAPVERFSKLPNLFVVGPAKTGTTALYFYFKAHPQIYTTPVKETNYMAFCDGVPSMAGPGDEQTISSISATTLADYTALYANWRTEPVAADVSPSYMHFPRAATKIAELCPQAKIVIVLRNPVECAFSMYAMRRRDKRETCRTFRQSLSRIDERLAAGWEAGWDYLRQFLISQAVARYMELFPRSQLFIRRYEMLKQQPERFYGELCRFLQIEPIEVDGANQRVNAAASRREHLRTTLGGHLLMRATKIFGLLVPRALRRSMRRRFWDAPALQLGGRDRRMLIDYFGADILKLAELLDWDLADWVRP